MTGSNPSTQTLGFNDGNQIATNGYTYDGAGNLTARPGDVEATFDTAGQMRTHSTGSGGDTTYTYAETNQNEIT